ncbi:hypothetical protein NAT51_12830 [Flavobacterium amniphilum]|uniref:hypothetical protein n=1 Tax=Flavobacterium amniphilum TaxID=1834035 RepID=UPI00202A3D24|nr:hypothetical protein [Flavobacterium amniphilum]MCL9805827.1 hypothetical protein [Flavobacterium amniphilum]MCL9806414.1 hypothetical protein [Flavobacterium amniphilum]
MKESIDYIRKAELLAKQYPTNGFAKAFLRTLEEEGSESENTLSDAKALIQLKR